MTVVATSIHDSRTINIEFVMKKISLSILFFASIFSLVILSGCLFRSPEATAKQYWKAIMTGNETKAKTLVIDSEENGLETFIHPSDGSKVEFGETTVAGDTASVDTILTWADDQYDTTFRIQTVLKKSDGEWKVDAAESRQIFVAAVYNSTLNGLQKAFESTATEFRRLGEELLGTVASDLSEASKELHEGAEEAKVEIDKFLKQIDQNLAEELKKHSVPPPPTPDPAP